MLLHTPPHTGDPPTPPSSARNSEGGGHFPVILRNVAAFLSLRPVGGARAAPASARCAEPRSCAFLCWLVSHTHVCRQAPQGCCPGLRTPPCAWTCGSSRPDTLRE